MTWLVAGPVAGLWAAVYTTSPCMIWYITRARALGRAPPNRALRTSTNANRYWSIARPKSRLSRSIHLLLRCLESPDPESLTETFGQNDALLPLDVRSQQVVTSVLRPESRPIKA